MEPALTDVSLRARYDCACAACGHAFTAAPSLLMELGENTGWAKCSGCGTSLHLTVHPDLGGDRMVSEPYDAFRLRLAESRTAAQAPSPETLFHVPPDLGALEAGPGHGS